MPSIPRLRGRGSRPVAAAQPTRPGKGGDNGKGRGKGKGKPSRAERRAARANRWSQLKQAFVLTRQRDPRMLPLVIGVFLAVLLLFVLVGFLFGHPLFIGLFGITFGLLAAISLFGRRAQRAAFSQVEGQPGAALAVVNSMRGQWNVTPVVGVNRNSDVVHRVLGRPGIVLVGEGHPTRLAQLVGQEKRRIGRVAADTPVYDVLVGNGDGQVPLHKLQTHLSKLPRNLRPAEVRALDGRLKALGQAQPPVPKGPLPRNARMPRGRTR